MTDYKEKYEQALQRARQFSEKPYLEDSAGIVEYIFPELAISEDERIRKALLTYFSDEDESYDGIPYPNICAWIKKKGEQMPAEWSKADEDMIYNIMNMIFKYAFSQSAVDVNGDLCESEYIEADQWLRSLEDRCILQPKQEWSEEDEKMIKSCIFCFKQDLEKAEVRFSQSNLLSDIKEEYEKKINWLKTLKQRNTWKPSEEQLNALSLTSFNDFPEYRDILKSLYDDLKKL